MSRQRTIYLQNAIDGDTALCWYYQLRDSIEWEEGVRSRNGFTRKAKSINLVDYPDLFVLVAGVLADIVDQTYTIYGTYLNFYEDGTMYTPNHTHKRSSQLIISLGVTRTLRLGNATMRWEMEMLSYLDLVFTGYLKISQ